MKPVYLLDTNVISEFAKPKPNQNVLKMLPTLTEVSAFGFVAFVNPRPATLVTCVSASMSEWHSLR